MRILMLAHRLPYPPRTGDKVRAYHVARHLARDHELTLACLVDEPDPEPALSALRREIPDLECATLPRGRKRLEALLRLARGGSATMAYLGKAARRFVEVHHSWTGSMARLDGLLAEVARRPGNPALRHGERP